MPNPNYLQFLRQVYVVFYVCLSIRIHYFRMVDMVFQQFRDISTIFKLVIQVHVCVLKFWYVPYRTFFKAFSTNVT